MPSYRPITDTWILARAKLKEGRALYGAYPGGFLERARVLLGASINDAVLHVCAGAVRYYPYKGGVGHNDRTLDMAPTFCPDYCQDVRDEWPSGPWRAVLADPPYTIEDSARYLPGPSAFPSPSQILERAWEVIPTGGRVGILHYIVPRPPAPNAKFIAMVSVMVGFNNRVRAFTVFGKE